jgi:hypothetical protein
MTTIDTVTSIITALVALVGGYFALTATQETQIIAGGVALAGAAIAYFQKTQTTAIISAMTPGTAVALTPALAASLPTTSWKMSDATKEWLTFDATPNNKARMLSEIAAAEAANLVEYRINYIGGYTEVKYGLIEADVGSASKDIGSDGTALGDDFYENPLSGHIWASYAVCLMDDPIKPPANQTKNNI